LSQVLLENIKKKWGIWDPIMGRLNPEKQGNDIISRQAPSSKVKLNPNPNT
jgi:hypothetical protein